MAPTPAASLRAPSIRSGSSTPHPQPSSVVDLSHDQPSGLSHLFRHMFDSPKHTIFAATITVHELNNVPQLEGEFAVRWKFRGHRPRDVERYAAASGSLTPNGHPGDRQAALNSQRTPLRPSASVNGLRPSSSLASLRTASTSSTGASTPRSFYMPVPQAHHSATMPPTSRATGVPREKTETKKPEKKSSDPTPLRQSTLVDSPIEMSSRSLAPDDEVDDAWYSTTDSQSSGYRPTLKDAFGSELSVPTNRTIVSRSGVQLPKVQRTPSSISQRSSAASTTYLDDIQPEKPDSDARKGTTQFRPIRAHTVQWQYKLQYVIRVPLSKPGSHTPGSRVTLNDKGLDLPILGAGPHSDSSIKLEIFQASPWSNESSKRQAAKNQVHKVDRHGTVFGFVEIDLAPFANLGPTTRSFLLRSSKTNATIRVTVNMQYVGGQKLWATPPMTEGHPVGGIAQLTGDDTMYPDLQLLPTPSISSQSDNSSGPSKSSNPSSVSLSKQPGVLNAASHVHATKHRYTTFDHHLRPEHATRHSRHGASTERALSPPLRSRRILSTDEPLTTSPALEIGALRRPSLAPLHIEGDGQIGYFDRVPPAFSPLSPIVSRAIGTDTSPATSLSPVALLAPDNSPPAAHIQDSHHEPRHEHRKGSTKHGSGNHHDLPAELVIENVFNPEPGEDLTPFTFVPQFDDADDVDTSESGLQLEVAPEEHVSAEKARRWQRIRRRVISNPHRVHLHRPGIPKHETKAPCRVTDRA